MGYRHSSVMSLKKIDSFSDGRDSDIPSDSGCLTIVVLGASGDLAKKKTFPALFNLFRQVFYNSCFQV